MAVAVAVAAAWPAWVWVGEGGAAWAVVEASLEVVAESLGLAGEEEEVSVG